MSWVSEIGPMSVRNMRYFVAFVECGTISGGAAKVGSSAAVLRARMKSLGDALGQPLFDRSGPELKLTEAGAGLFLACKETLAQLDSIQKDIKSAHARGIVAGRVSLGIDPGIARILMPSVILPFLDAHPKLDIVAYEASGATLHSWLEEGMIDLAIGMPAVRHWWVTELAGYEERLVLCSRNPLPDDAGFSEPAERDESVAPMFACYPISPDRATVLDWNNPPLQVNGFLSSMAFVNKGSWCAVVPLSAVLGEVETGNLHIRPVASLSSERRMIARHTDKPLNEAGELIVSAISGALDGLAGRMTAHLDQDEV